MADDRPREGIDWEAIERSPEFQELVRKRRAFVLPGTIFYLAWYMGFILLVAYAEDFMSESVYEGLTVGYCLALTQFVMVLVLGLLVPAQERQGVRPAGREGDRGVRAPPGSLRRRRRPGERARDRGAGPMIVFAAVNTTAVVDLLDRPGHHAGHHLLGVEARLERRRLLRRRPRHQRPPERPRDLRRLPVGRVVPRHRRPDLPVRLRRVRLLDRLPRRVPHRDVPARRADAELRQVHDRRRARLPPARAARARRGGDRHAQRRRLLPDRADGRRGRADPGARRASTSSWRC